VKATIDPAKCVGHGMCYATAPDVYEDDDDGFGRLRDGGEVRPGFEDRARTGAANCPEQAITLVN
jgi:ferredoxin